MMDFSVPVHWTSLRWMGPIPRKGKKMGAIQSPGGSFLEEARKTLEIGLCLFRLQNSPNHSPFSRERNGGAYFVISADKIHY